MLPRNSIACLMIAAAALGACDEDSAERSAPPQGEVRRETAVACFDSVEARAIACASPTAARISPDSLRLRFGDAHDTTFVNTEGAENNDYSFQYWGRIGRPAYHVVEESESETYPKNVLLNARTGRATYVDSIAMSPDSTRIATIAIGWDNCTEGGEARLTIWRLTDSVLVKEYEQEAPYCPRGPHWAPSEVRWAGDDTIRYTRVDMPAGDVSPWTRHVVTMVRAADGWRTIDQP